MAECVDEKIQVHQLRQFLQTSSHGRSRQSARAGPAFSGQTPRTDSSRDKIDFLLVQYFSQDAPTDLDDNGADLAYVAQGLEPVLGKLN